MTKRKTNTIIVFVFNHLKYLFVELAQNGGRLSKRVRAKEFSDLKDFPCIHDLRLLFPHQ